MLRVRRAVTKRRTRSRGRHNRLNKNHGSSLRLRKSSLRLQKAGAIAFNTYTKVPALREILNYLQLAPYKFRVHFWYTGWPDHGVPSSDQLPAFATFLQNIYNLISGPYNIGRTLIHCSAGVGRTGTMLALLYLLNEVYGNKMKSKLAPQIVMQIIHIMRKYRPHLVQTAQQLRFIFDVLTHFQAIDPLTQDQWMEFENDFENPEFQRPRYLLAGHGEASCPTKNRYSNIKPYAERSLDLTGQTLYSSDYCGPTYINASPLPPIDQLYLTRRQMNPNDPPPQLNPKDSYMIAGQCPPNNATAINDFNQMLLAHDVRVIIDLTRFDEGGAAKCVDYTNGILTRQLNEHPNVPFIVTLYAKQQPHRYLDVTGMFFGQSQPVHPSPLPNRPLTLKQLNEMYPSKCDSESEV